MDDYTKIRQIMVDVLKPSDKLHQERYENIQKSLNTIDNHLEKLNGKVADHEKILNNITNETSLHVQNDENYMTNRHVTCPQISRIEELEKRRFIAVGIKQLIISALSIIAVMFSIALGAVKLSEHYSTQDRETQTKEIIKEVIEEMRNDETNR